MERIEKMEEIVREMSVFICDVKEAVNFNEVKYSDEVRKLVDRLEESYFTLSDSVSNYKRKYETHLSYFTILK